MSTPMEINTEELQEILQQVYDLPDAGSGGSSEPDLVIGLNWRNPNTDRRPGPLIESEKYTAEDISIESGSIATVVEKLDAGLPIKVLMQEVNFYNRSTWASGQTEASQVYIGHFGGTVYPDTPASLLICTFYMQNTVTSVAWPAVTPIAVSIAFDLTTGEPVRYASARMF